MPQCIYLDNAATTPVAAPVLEAMMPYFSMAFGNASSTHAHGREARTALFAARDAVARAIHGQPEEIYFTSGGTEADNWAVRGAAYASKRGKHIITSRIEHHAVLRCTERLEREGFEVTYLSPDAQGRIDPDLVRRAIRPDTALVSIMAANNEVGTVQPIAEIGAFCEKYGVPFHTDAVQAMGSLEIDVRSMHIDMLSLSAHKLYGPKGVGALYIRKGLQIQNLVDGGMQERSKRGGTENIPGIVGLAKALELSSEHRDADRAHISNLRKQLLEGILRIPDVQVNGHPEETLPGILNVSIRHVKPEALLLSLDREGIAASSGAACAAGSIDPSHVLLAMGLDREDANCALRLSIGRQNTADEISRVVEILPRVVHQLRETTLFAGENNKPRFV